MNIEQSEAPVDRRFDKKHRRQTRRPWTFESGFSALYPQGEYDIWPETFVREIDDGKLYVDYREWPIDGDEEQGMPSLRVPTRGDTTYMPFYWKNEVIINAQNSVRVQNEIMGLVALESIPVVIYTPTLYLMLNGTPRDTPSDTLNSPYPKVISSLDVFHAYQLVETLFTTNKAEFDVKRIRQARIKHNKDMLQLKAGIQQKLKEIPNGDAYVKRIFDLVRAQGGNPNALAALDDEEDAKVIELFARITISYQISYLHMLEVFLIRLLMPSVEPKQLDPRFFTCDALPAAHPDHLFDSAITALEPDLIKESLVVLRSRALHFKVDIKPTEMALEQRVCGLPAHFFRLLFLITSN